MRSRVEVALGLVALAALLLLGGPARRPSGDSLITSGGTAPTAALTRWTSRAVDTVAVKFSEGPAPMVRDWLAALRGAGSVVTWHGSVPVAALEAERRADPLGTVLVRVASRDSGGIVVGDALGLADSVSATRGGAVFTLPAAAGAVTGTVPGARLRRALEPDGRAAAPPAVALYAKASWESRYVVAALEAAGWPLEARLRVGPGNVVTQGRPWPPDTARHAVIIVLDSLDAATALAVGAYVRAGGGLVAGAGAAGLGAVAAGRPGRPVRPPSGLSLPASRRDLVYRPLVRLASGAVPLEETDDGSRVAARRVGAGRVVQLGDVETWRLALASDAGRAEHAALWRGAVALAAPRAPARPAAGDDVAPRAALAAALGPPAGDDNGRARRVNREPLLAALLLLSLLAEWTSRRVTGRM